MEFSKNFRKEDLLAFYNYLRFPRLIEERMLMLLRQNKIAKWFSGIGQEAVSVGVVHASHPEDYILPMHRNLGIFTGRNVDLYRLFCQLFGKADGFTGGRDRSFHFGLPEHRIIGMISHLAAMLPVADGLALAAKLKDENAVAFAFCGDGATSEGDFHEALNLAAVWKLPVIFIIENNGYGLSTPVKEQYACKHLADRGVGYGIKSDFIDGNNVFEVFESIKKARGYVRRHKKPYLIEAKTFRMRGHEEASGTAYVPDDMFEAWSDKDPIKQVSKLLLNEYGVTEEDLDAIDHGLRKRIEGPLKKALKANPPKVDSVSTDHELVFAPFSIPKSSNSDPSTKTKRFIDAIQDGLYQAMDEDESTIIMGQDIAEYGGVFKVTQGFLEKFGIDRIRNTPIIESGIIGAAYGLTLAGYKPIVEMQFSDFMSCGFNQIVNNLAKSYYRWSDGINVTIRAPHGAGVAAGPFHSQSPEGWFMPHAGLKVLVPGTVSDAQSMIYTAIQDPNPVIIFEHKLLYRSLKEDVSKGVSFEDPYKANILRQGTDLTLITYGAGVQWALRNVNDIEAELGISIELLDLRSLSPVDFETIQQSISKTNRALLLEEASGQLGPMSEISALINEYCFTLLDAPVVRCSSRNTPIPTNKILEDDYIFSKNAVKKIKQVIQF